MNYDEVSKVINQNSKTKKINTDYTRTEVDINTGEMRRVIESHAFSVETEPDYIKLYTGFQLLFNDLDPNLMPYIVAFGRYMGYANNDHYRLSIRTDRMVRKGVSEACGVSDSRVKKVIRKLIDSNIFIPYVDSDTGKKTRGIYFVNPWVMAKGEWKDIKQLRSQFEFVSGASSTVLIDEEGLQKIVVPLTYKEGSNGQLSMDIESNKRSEHE